MMERGGEEPFTVPDEDGDLTLDLDVLSYSAPARPTVKFLPKLKGKGKLLPPKGDLSSESNSSLGACPTLKQEDAVKAQETEKMDAASNGELEERKLLHGDPAPMDVDDESAKGEDVVVREIDVFFNRSFSDTDTQLYVMQYPLRPCWRPYELNEMCQEVRMKPKQSKMEFHMNMDFNSENYDNEVDEQLRIQKRVLSSSKVPFVIGYAVGMLVGNQLHLNPVHTVLQLRPSMAHIDASGPSKKQYIAQSEGVAYCDEKNGEEYAKLSTSLGKMIPEASNENVDDSEDWVTLGYHAMNSTISSMYQKKMLCEEGDQIAFSTNMHDYLDCICPGRSVDNGKPGAPSRRIS